MSVLRHGDPLRSRISGQREEGEPPSTSTNRFLEIGEGEDDNDNDNDKNENDDDNEENNDEDNDNPAPNMRPKIGHDSDYFHQITRYLKAKHTEHQIKDKIEEDALN